MFIEINFQKELHQLQLQKIGQFLTQLQADNVQNFLSEFIKESSMNAISNLNLNENKLNLLKKNPMASIIFAGYMTHNSSYNPLYWQNKQMDAILSSTGSSSELSSGSSSELSSGSSSGSSSIYITKINHFLYDYRLNTPIHGYIINRVIFDKIDVLNVFNPYCEWSMKYMDPADYLIFIIDIVHENNDELNRIRNEFKQLQKIWNDNKIIIKDHLEFQKWIHSWKRQDNNIIGCSVESQRKITKLLST